MSSYNLLRVAAAMPKVEITNCRHNTDQIKALALQGVAAEVSLMVFPELSITGYSCADLFFQKRLLDRSLESLIELKHFTAEQPISLVVGLPLKMLGTLYNCAAFLSGGEIVGIVPKTYLPTNNEFYEARWFSGSNTMIDQEILIDEASVPIGPDLVFAHEEMDLFKLGIEVCEDLWAPLPPSTYLALNGATLIANPSASNEIVGKIEYRRSLIANQAARTYSAYVYASAGFGESTTDVVYGGHCLINESGSLLAENKRFALNSHFITTEVDLERLSHDRMKQSSFKDSAHLVKAAIYREIPFHLELPEHYERLNRSIDPHPFVPGSKESRDLRCEEIFAIQTSGLAKRLSHIGCKKVVLGISGGLDSTLALLVCAKTYELLGIPASNIIAVTMPGFGTTDRTYQNALHLISGLGATFIEIPIKTACLEHFSAIGHDPDVHDLTYENTQARERTQILMDLATKENAFVVGTGDLSELALGWATYNGDHMSMYGVNASIPKTLVRYLVEWVASTAVDDKTKGILMDILDTPVSPELLPPDEHGQIVQKTEEVVGPYELHDFFLYQILRFGYAPQKVKFLAQHAFDGIYTDDTILYWLRIFYKRFFSQQFKRSCLPDGPKVGSMCLSPRGDWRMPSDAVAYEWLENLE